ncbi:MAG: EamA family transporter [Sphingobacteriaceae bacterium]
MPSTAKNSAALPLVILAYAIVYIVWGSTYFFIHIAVEDIPPFILGAFRFTTAGIVMFLWSLYKREKVFDLKTIKHAAVGGILLLLIGNGVVIWVEQYQPSALVAILVSGSPLWFVILDKPNWHINFKSRNTLLGLLMGFGGVILLFYEKINALYLAGGEHAQIGLLVLLVIASMAWAGGSLYSKHYSLGSKASVITTWQMLIAGILFIPGSIISGEYNNFNWREVSSGSWMAAVYLVIFGSLAAFSAYVWLLSVRPATQVSTYAYVNPVVAVLLGVLFANEQVSLVQLLGLGTILMSVLLINLSKYRQSKGN